MTWHGPRDSLTRNNGWIGLWWPLLVAAAAKVVPAVRADQTIIAVPRDGIEAAAEAGQRIERAVDKVSDGIRPMEFGGPNGTADIAKAVLAAL